MNQTNNKRTRALKLDDTEDFWTKLNAEMSENDIAKMHKQIAEDLGYNPNDVEPVGCERWWLVKKSV